MNLPTLKPGRCFGYIRVSTKDQADEGVSLLAQEALIEKRYETVEKPKGHESFRLFRDDGVSAFKKSMSQRPQGSMLLNAVQPGDTVIFATMDRAFRGISDGRLTLAWFQKKQVRVVILNIGGEAVDSSTTSGFVSTTMYLFMAELESRQKAERIQAAHDYNYKKRGFAGFCMPGFKTIRTSTKRLRQVIDWDYVTNAENALMTIWYEGHQKLAERMQAGEIEFVKKHKTRRSGTSKCTGATQKANEGQRRAVLALWFTGRLKAFCALHGKVVEDFLDVENKRLKSSNTDNWYGIASNFWPKGPALPQVDVLDDTGRPGYGESGRKLGRPRTAELSGATA